MADGWLNLHHPETGGVQRIPDDAAVLEAQRVRGWVLADRETSGHPEPYVAPDGEVPEWVEMTHPDLPAARQSVPNHPDAIAGQQAAGWVLPEPPKAPEVKARKPKETPAADAGTNDTAGDGTSEKE